MVHDNWTYPVVAGVAVDAAVTFPQWLPEPSLQNGMYLLTILWLGVQIYCKLKGKN